MPPEQPQSPLSVGVSWAYRITAIGLEFSLPTLAGYLLDRRWESSPVATLIGACLGFAAGLYHLILLTGHGRHPGRGE
ncbi:AtpZ/AtpI family protein [Tautonia plasticadhaerens]|uniref:F0F1-ATPase subunit (ATPase_gene1) n=1 Tax=Tautonia plasticadhaerens TaxID=2527974 RepID=A0A518H848_9BACT|nr:AtpZ/AtpI family protein [Tautonia plasticadhaerens]QDV37037.1 Putative F0F1-ATPase subunit (ATPase_gene1) [Tautonia plasticadhaerens]